MLPILLVLLLTLFHDAHFRCRRCCWLGEVELTGRGQREPGVNTPAGHYPYLPSPHIITTLLIYSLPSPHITLLIYSLSSPQWLIGRTLDYLIIVCNSPDFLHQWPNWSSITFKLTYLPMVLKFQMIRARLSTELTRTSGDWSTSSSMIFTLTVFDFLISFPSHDMMTKRWKEKRK